MICKYALLLNVRAIWRAFCPVVRFSQMTQLKAVHARLNGSTMKPPVSTVGHVHGSTIALHGGWCMHDPWWLFSFFTNLATILKISSLLPNAKTTQREVHMRIHPSVWLTSRTYWHFLLWIRKFVVFICSISDVFRIVELFRPYFMWYLRQQIFISRLLPIGLGRRMTAESSFTVQ